MYNSKKQNNIDVPHIIELSKYVIGYKSGDNTYELYGVCNHSGVTQGGHYTANVKNANGKWVRCELNLDDYKDASAFTIAFRVKTYFDTAPNLPVNGMAQLSNVHFVASEK